MDIFAYCITGMMWVIIIESYIKNLKSTGRKTNPITVILVIPVVGITYWISNNLGLTYFVYFMAIFSFFFVILYRLDKWKY